MHIPPPVLALIAILLLYLADWLAPGLSLSLSGQWLFAGAVILVGLGIAFVALRGFFTAKTTFRPDELDKPSTLVTDGLYQFTRNPMYLGLALIVAGIGFGLGTWATPLMVFAFAWVITIRQILPEERALEGIFGEAYVDYKTNVRRWL